MSSIGNVSGGEFLLFCLPSWETIHSHPNTLVACMWVVVCKLHHFCFSTSATMLWLHMPRCHAHTASVATTTTRPCKHPSIRCKASNNTPNNPSPEQALAAAVRVLYLHAHLARAQHFVFVIACTGISTWRGCFPCASCCAQGSRRRGLGRLGGCNGGNGGSLDARTCTYV